ncbi:MAG: 50S ribosomal protein L9 [Lachnospiraceae bacterium]|nr:50S ribosomal protein L9 [Lachnospiraceae bacterium]
MKIILLTDDKKLGKKGDVIEVSEGHAKNFIIPKKIGIEATPKNLNDLKLHKANEEKKAKELLEQAQALAKDLEQKQVIVKIKAGEGGKTFGSVSTKEIAAAVKEQHGIEIDKKKIQLAENLKNFGSYEVTLKLHPQVAAKLSVKVTEE